MFDLDRFPLEPKPNGCTCSPKLFPSRPVSLSPF